MTIWIGQDIEISAGYSGDLESKPQDLTFYLMRPDGTTFSVDAEEVTGGWVAAISVNMSGLWTLDARSTMPFKARAVTYFYVNTAPLVIVP